jgi:hypothetical protein
MALNTVGHNTNPLTRRAQFVQHNGAHTIMSSRLPHAFNHVLYAVFCLTIPVDATAQQASPLEELLEKSRTSDVTYEHVGLIFKARSEAPSAGVNSCVIKACGAGLCYLGKTDVYTRTVRELIPNNRDFERSLVNVCKSCMGKPTVKQPCQKCAGDGRCKNHTCSGGRTRHPGFDGRTTYRRCSVCKGTGRCKACGATGVSEQKCRTCRGKGGSFSRSKALAVYRKQVEDALGLMHKLVAQAEQEAAERDLQANLREVKLEAEKEAIIARAKAEGQERARQMALVEREIAERELKEKEDAKHAEQDRGYLKSVVIIQGDKGQGTGFLCELRGKRVVLSNAHVLCGNRNPRITTINEGDVRYEQIWVCRDRDIVAYEVEDPDKFKYMTIYSSMGDLNNRERVVVFGNSGGRKVVTSLRGQVQGIGPDRIEVNATFVGGNSGSPVVAYDYGAVVGMATYVTKDPQVDWAKRSTRFAEVRRFAVRVDNITWEDFFVLDRDEYTRTLNLFDELTTFKDREIMKARWSGAYRPTEPIKQRALGLLVRYRDTPEWMRTYADDALLAAYFCKRITE